MNDTIIVDEDSNVDDLAEEAFGLSNLIALRDNATLDDFFNRSDVKEALIKAKDWGKRKGFKVPTISEASNNGRNLFMNIFRRGGKIGQYTTLSNTDIVSAIKHITGVSKISYKEVNGLIIEIVDVFASATELMAVGLIPGIIRAANNKQMYLFYVVFKKSNDSIFIKHLCKSVIDNKNSETQEDAINKTIWSSLRNDQ